MKKLFYLMAAVAFLSGLTACDNQDELTAAGASDNSVLAVNGDCDIYTLQNSENADWTITSCPDWVTPVQESGTNGNQIQLYVESNTRTPLRKGSVTIKYANGVTRSTRVEQTNETSDFSLQRSYAAGWSFDIRTYNDIRGVRQQIFNTQKLKKSDNAGFFIEPYEAISDQIYYGEDMSSLQSNIAANLNLDIKYNAFSLNLEGSFGRNTLSNSKRVFSWVRHLQSVKEVSINVDAQDAAAGDGMFTAEFAAMRQEVIDAEGSDESIARLIEIYGTHYVGSAILGGCFDYYYSTILTNKVEQDTIEGAVTAGFEKKFKIDISGDASYENANSIETSETIERFEIKGGDAVSLARAVEDGSIGEEAIEAWKATIEDSSDAEGNVIPGKTELISFGLLPIQKLFPSNVKSKITDYLNRMYYRELPLTRSEMQREL